MLRRSNKANKFSFAYFYRCLGWDWSWRRSWGFNWQRLLILECWSRLRIVISIVEQLRYISIDSSNDGQTEQEEFLQNTAHFMFYLMYYLIRYIDNNKKTITLHGMWSKVSIWVITTLFVKQSTKSTKWFLDQDVNNCLFSPFLRVGFLVFLRALDLRSYCVRMIWTFNRCIFYTKSMNAKWILQ